MQLKKIFCILKKLEDNARNTFETLSLYCHTNIPDFWLANKIFHNNLCVFIIISAFSYLLQLLISLVYPPYLYILYDECSEYVRGEYSSLKYQLCN